MAFETAVTMKSILFVCTGNAGRSQMAEAMMRRLASGCVEVYSAGVAPQAEVHPVARKLMRKCGNSLDGHYTKPVSEFSESAFDYVVTIGQKALQQHFKVCGNPRRIHWVINDPAEAEDSIDVELLFGVAFAELSQRTPRLLEFLKGNATASDLHMAPAISTLASRPDRFEPGTHVAEIARSGFRAIELNIVADSDFEWKNRGLVHELMQVCADEGIRVWSIHAPGSNNDLACRDGRVRGRAVDTLKQVLDLACELGALVVPVHSKFKHEQIEQGTHGKDDYFASIAQASDHALSLPCVLTFENSGQSKTCWRFGEAAERLEKLTDAGVGFVCDTGHANILRNDIDEYLPRLSGKLRSLHVNDNFGDHKDPHLLPGEGAIDWPGFMRLCRECEYTGPIVLEVKRPHNESLNRFLVRAYEAAMRLASLCDDSDTDVIRQERDKSAKSKEHGMPSISELSV